VKRVLGSHADSECDGCRKIPITVRRDKPA
jgi:hypothetical protein